MARFEQMRNWDIRKLIRAFTIHHSQIEIKISEISIEADKLRWQIPFRARSF